MTERRKLHPNYKVNLRKFAADEGKTSEQGYVVKFGNGARKYFPKHSQAKKFEEVLIMNGHTGTDIINLAKQGVPLTKMKKQLSVRVGGQSFYGASLTSNELASMVLGRMGEATTHQFKRIYPTMEMRKAAQRALKHKVMKEGGTQSSVVKEALALKLHTLNERKS